MTTLNAPHDTVYVNKEELRRSFSGSGSSTPRRIGVEGEFFIVEPDTLKFVAPDVIASIVETMSTHGYNLQTEACSVVEINSPPFRLSDEMDLLYAFCDAAEQKLGCIVDTAGFHILPTSVHPFQSLKHALDVVVDRPRVHDMIRAMKNLPHNALLVGLMTASAQVSTDYGDAEDLYKILHRGYALSPLLISLFATDTGRLKGVRVSQHIRTTLYQAYGENAHGIPSYLAHCYDGEQLIQQHLRAIGDTKMLYYFDKEGNVVVPHSQSAMQTFNELCEHGLGTNANHEAAESFNFPDIKFKPLPDGKRRIEFRLPDTGPGHMKMAAAVISALVCQPETASAFDQLLQHFGFKGTFGDDLNLMVKNRSAAIQFPGCWDIPFGNGLMNQLCESIKHEILPIINPESKTSVLISSLLRNRALTLSYRQLDNARLHAALKKPNCC